jgi:hypothetical protein
MAGSNLQFCPSICLEGCRKTRKTLSQYSQILELRTEPRTFQMQSMNANHSTTTCDAYPSKRSFFSCTALDGHIATNFYQNTVKHWRMSMFQPPLPHKKRTLYRNYLVDSLIYFSSMNFECFGQQYDNSNKIKCTWFMCKYKSENRFLNSIGAKFVSYRIVVTYCLAHISS